MHRVSFDNSCAITPVVPRQEHGTSHEVMVQVSLRLILIGYLKINPLRTYRGGAEMDIEWIYIQIIR